MKMYHVSHYCDFFSFDTGVKLTLSALVDGKNFNAGGHQLGLGLDFEA